MSNLQAIGAGVWSEKELAPRGSNFGGDDVFFFRINKANQGKRNGIFGHDVIDAANGFFDSAGEG